MQRCPCPPPPVPPLLPFPHDYRRLVSGQGRIRRASFLGTLSRTVPAHGLGPTQIAFRLLGGGAPPEVRDGRLGSSDGSSTSTRGQSGDVGPCRICRGGGRVRDAGVSPFAGCGDQPLHM